MADELTREDWLRERKTGIGGSDAAAILGLSKWATPHDVWVDKMSPLVVDEGPTPDMERGRVLEPIAVELWEERTGHRSRRQPMRRHPEHPFLFGNCDRQIFQTASRDTGILEVKCPRYRTLRKVEIEGLPPDYIIQMQHYLNVFGYEWGEFALFNAENWRLLNFAIERDDELIASMERRLVEWWDWHIVQGHEPVQEVEPIELPSVDGEVVDVGEDQVWLEACGLYDEARQMEKDAAEIKKVAKAKLTSFMADAPVVQGGGFRAYHREQAGRVTFDRKALAKAKPLDPIATVLFDSLIPRDGAVAQEIADLIQKLRRECELDLTQFEKKGKPFKTLKFYHTEMHDE